MKQRTAPKLTALALALNLVFIIGNLGLALGCWALEQLTWLPDGTSRLPFWLAVALTGTLIAGFAVIAVLELLGGKEQR